jgi:hypothetical protein
MTLYKSPVFIFWTGYALFAAYMMFSNIGHLQAGPDNQIHIVGNVDFFIWFFIVIMYITGLSTWIFCIWFYNRQDRIICMCGHKKSAHSSSGKWCWEDDQHSNFNCDCKGFKKI